MVRQETDPGVPAGGDRSGGTAPAVAVLGKERLGTGLGATVSAAAGGAVGRRRPALLGYLVRLVPTVPVTVAAGSD